MENDIVSDLEVFLEANKDSEGSLLVIFGKDVIHRSKKGPVDYIAGKLYGLLHALDKTPTDVLKRYVDFDLQGEPVFIPFSILRNATLKIELSPVNSKVH